MLLWLCMKKIYTKDAPEPIGPYSQCIETNGVYFLSGQIGLKNGKLENQNIKTETKQVLSNVLAILKKAGLEKDNIIKVDIDMTDLSKFTEVNEVYEEFLGNHKPARKTVGVSSLPLGAQIEITVTAVK